MRNSYVGSWFQSLWIHCPGEGMMNGSSLQWDPVAELIHGNREQSETKGRCNLQKSPHSGPLPQPQGDPIFRRFHNLSNNYIILETKFLNMSI